MPFATRRSPGRSDVLIQERFHPAMDSLEFCGIKFRRQANFDSFEYCEASVLSCRTMTMNPFCALDMTHIACEKFRGFVSMCNHGDGCISPHKVQQGSLQPAMQLPTQVIGCLSWNEDLFCRCRLLITCLVDGRGPCPRFSCVWSQKRKTESG